MLLKTTAGLAAAALIAATSACQTGSMTKPMASKNMAHVHMGHVTTSWGDTPGKAGLLPTAIAEARIAATHADLAAKQPRNLAWMKMHTRHVLHAIDPTLEPKGPGKGYGVIKASTGVVKHVGFAAASKGASKNVKTHAVHVAASAQNTVDRARQIVRVAKAILATKSTRRAARLVKRQQALAHQLVDGLDANRDGKVTWVKGEGGLMQAQQHMGFMRKGEKM